MIKVRKLDNNGDRTFGNGKANFINEDLAISQNIATRLKSFKADFFLNIEDNIDWFNLLGQKNNEQIIKAEIYRVALATDGVVTVNNVTITRLVDRDATFELSVDTIYKRDIQLQFNLNLGT